MHLNALALTPNQASLSKSLEMVRQRRLRNTLFADLQKVRADMGTLRTCQLRKNRHTYWIGESMQDGFDGDIFDRGMEERPHTFIIVVLT